MASTYSPILRIELIGTGEQSGTWGSTTNVNLGTLIEQAIAGTTTIDVSAGNVTLSNFNGTSDQARCAAIRVIGVPGTSRNIVAPAVSKIYVVANGSDAAVVLKTSTSTGLTIPAGEVFLAYYDPTVGTADFRLVGRASASTNTANTLVLRDGSGNFAAGVITATGFTGPIGVGTPAAALFTSVGASGNVSLGDSSSDTLTVNATPTFNVAIPVASGGTGVTTSTGTGSVVRATSPTLVTPVLGTPSSGTLTSCTGLPVSTGVSGLGTNVATFLGTPSSANLAAAVTDETGSGALVFATSPTLVTPALGTPTSGNLTNCTFPTLNQNTSGSAGSIANAGGWSITPSGTTLFINYNGTNVAKISSAGVITAANNITAFGTV
jgi:hypothetical protein